MTNSHNQPKTVKNTPMTITQNPYEHLKALNKSLDNDTITLEEKRLRLECIRVAIMTGIKDSDIVLEMAKRYWDFLQLKEND